MESEGLRFVSSWELRIFLCPTLVIKEKTSFSVSLLNLKLTSGIQDLTDNSTAEDLSGKTENFA